MQLRMGSRSDGRAGGDVDSALSKHGGRPLVALGCSDGDELVLHLSRRAGAVASASSVTAPFGETLHDGSRVESSGQREAARWQPGTQRRGDESRLRDGYATVTRDGTRGAACSASNSGDGSGGSAMPRAAAAGEWGGVRGGGTDTDSASAVPSFALGDVPNGSRGEASRALEATAAASTARLHAIEEKFAQEGAVTLEVPPLLCGPGGEAVALEVSAEGRFEHVTLPQRHVARDGGGGGGVAAASRSRFMYA